MNVSVSKEGFELGWVQRPLGLAAVVAGVAAGVLGICWGAWETRAAGLEPFNTEPNTDGPMEAGLAAARTALPPGFRLSVFAAEPDVHQPIAMATDPRGRLWVAENHTYSERKTGYHSGLRDRIVVFEDFDGDGRFDRRRVFWDGGERLTSVEVGLGGVWALALPHLMFIPDADGDGAADGPPEVILDGFEYERGRHTVANGLRWGPDGWLYGRHGIQSTSRIGPPGTEGAARLAMNVGIWRYHPGRRVVEAVAEGTTNPWGMDWDARGELFFINTVIGHLWHVIPGAHYRRMYGADSTPNLYELIEQHADHVHWGTGEVWTDVRRGVTDETSAAGGGHAHTGLLIYQGGQWPKEWAGKLLTVNYHGRRLNVERLERRGSGFVGRHEPDMAMFADPWFRGIDLIAAPDGGVFISDWSDAGECHDDDGIHRTSGRIYKLSHGDGGARQGRGADLAGMEDLDLAAEQKSANDWRARQARRVLADRARLGLDLKRAREALSRMATGEGDEVVRLRALWALHAMGGAEAGLLFGKLTGTESERAWALRLMEDARHGSAGARERFDIFAARELVEFARGERAPSVRLALASLLQKLRVAQRMELARVLLARGEDAEDANLPLMLWYAIEPMAAAEEGFIDLIVEARIPRVQRLGARRLAQEIEAAPGRVEELIGALRRSAAGGGLAALLDGLREGFAGRRQVKPPAAWEKAKVELRGVSDEGVRGRVRELSVLFGDPEALGELKAIALGSGVEVSRRRAALQTLAEMRPPGLREVCEALLGERELGALAARGLASFDDPAIADRVLAGWGALSEQDRGEALGVLLTRPSWAGKVLEAIADGRVRREVLSVAQARQIRGFKVEGLSKRLGEVWGTLKDPDEASRQGALRRWKRTLTPEAIRKANAGEGRKLYGAACGVCHRLHGEGASIGPDLTGSGRQNLDYLLDNILFPSAVAPAGFQQTTLELKDGRLVTGIVRSRTGGNLLVDMVGGPALIAEADVLEERRSELSLMPEGLLDGLSEGQVIDLFGYLMGGGEGR